LIEERQPRRLSRPPAEPEVIKKGRVLEEAPGSRRRGREKKKK
jgi:hypothetical protein